VEENEGDDTISEEEELGEASKDEDLECDEEDDGDEHSVETIKVKKQSLMQNFL
jgi:hypothetical protein